MKTKWRISICIVPLQKAPTQPPGAKRAISIFCARLDRDVWLDGTQLSGGRQAEKKKKKDFYKKDIWQF